MRIACVHLPGLPLQVAAANRPDRSGRPVAVLGPGGQILACSRRAHALGVRPGMAPARARALAPALDILPGNERRWRDALVELGERVALLSPVVDVGPVITGAPAAVITGAPAGAALLAAVPRGARADRFARRLLREVEAEGYRARVGVAPDRFTAWAAARCGDAAVTVVRRGEAARFLAPLPLELLPLADEVRALLRAAGVHTLGAFAALPRPSLARPAAIDYQKLARGEGPSTLTASLTGTPRPPRRARPAAAVAAQLAFAS